MLAELLILLLTQNIFHVAESAAAVDAIFLDCAKASDRVDHNTLLTNIRYRYGNERGGADQLLSTRSEAVRNSRRLLGTFFVGQ